MACGEGGGRRRDANANGGIDIALEYRLFIYLRFTSYLSFLCGDADDCMYIYVSPNELQNKNPATVYCLPCDFR